MYKRPHHQHIAAALARLDGDKLLVHGCFFGGGTAISLLNGEFRESIDIDFLIADLAHYRTLRSTLTDGNGLQWLCAAGEDLPTLREVRADQYGIRTLIEMHGTPIKFEIVLEARIPLERPPALQPRVCGIATLTPLDLATSKLLANADRFADDSVFSRDIIDLAMMTPTLKLRDAAIAKAARAYGDAVVRDLVKAEQALRTRDQRLSRCMAALRMGQAPAPVSEEQLRARLANLVDGLLAKA